MWKESSSIQVRSRLRLFYMTALRGGRVQARLRRPMWVVMGFIIYETMWMVSPA